MTQEEKSLLLKDLSARLPYGVKIKYATCPANHCVFTLTELNVKTSYDKQYDLHYYPKLNSTYYYFDCLPYLRPMSSMTEEEKREYVSFGGQKTFDCDYSAYPKEYRYVYEWDLVNFFEWLNSHHFDYRGLIPKGLAIEAPEGMYN